MHKDGDQMNVYEHDQAEAARRPAQIRRDEHDPDWQGARRAAEAGHVRNVEPAAVLRLQRLAGNAGVASLVENEQEDDARSPVLDIVGKGGGAPLPAAVRGQMEAGLGADFSDVRIHHDAAAASSAQAVQAKAYTVGNEVVFNSGAYAPDTAAGQHTLAHELSHVVQQRSGPVDGTATGDGIALSHPQDRFEQEAEAAANSFGRQAETSAPTATASGGGAVQREGLDDDQISAQAMPLQREEIEEEEQPGAQMMPLQREGEEEEMEEEPA